MTKDQALRNLAARDPMIIGDTRPNLKPGDIISAKFLGDAFIGDEQIKLMVVRHAGTLEYQAAAGKEILSGDLAGWSFYEVTTD